MDERTELASILSRMTDDQWKWFLRAAAKLFTPEAMTKSVQHGTVGEVQALYQATGVFSAEAERAGAACAAAAYRDAKATLISEVNALDAIPA